MAEGWYPGSVIGRRYEVHAVRGGGQVRLIDAVDLRHQRRGALKVKILSEETDRARVLSEAGVLLAMRPAGVAGLVGETDGGFGDPGRFERRSEIDDLLGGIGRSLGGAH